MSSNHAHTMPQTHTHTHTHPPPTHTYTHTLASKQKNTSAPAQVEGAQKVNAALDTITLHANGGKAIVFVNTKAKADEVCVRVCVCVGGKGGVGLLAGVWLVWCGGYFARLKPLQPVFS